MKPLVLTNLLRLRKMLTVDEAGYAAILCTVHSVNLIKKNNSCPKAVSPPNSGFVHSIHTGAPLRPGRWAGVWGQPGDGGSFQPALQTRTACRQLGSRGGDVCSGRHQPGRGESSRNLPATVGWRAGMKDKVRALGITRKPQQVLADRSVYSGAQTGRQVQASQGLRFYSVGKPGALSKPVTVRTVGRVERTAPGPSALSPVMFPLSGPVVCTPSTSLPERRAAWDQAPPCRDGSAGLRSHPPLGSHLGLLGPVVPGPAPCPCMKR